MAAKYFARLGLPRLFIKSIWSTESCYLRDTWSVWLSEILLSGVVWEEGSREASPYPDYLDEWYLRSSCGISRFRRPAIIEPYQRNDNNYAWMESWQDNTYSGFGNQWRFAREFFLLLKAKIVNSWVILKTGFSWLFSFKGVSWTYNFSFRPINLNQRVTMKRNRRYIHPCSWGDDNHSFGSLKYHS